jgi:hypothetical protein
MISRKPIISMVVMRLNIAGSKMKRYLYWTYGVVLILAILLAATGRLNSVFILVLLLPLIIAGFVIGFLKLVRSTGKAWRNE